MMKLMIGIVALFAVACAVQTEDARQGVLDMHHSQSGLYGTYDRGEVHVDFAAFEVDAGAYAVTLIGNDFAIDTYLLPPGIAVVALPERPIDVVDPGPGSGSSNREIGELAAILRDQAPAGDPAVDAVLRAIRDARANPMASDIANE